MQNERRMANRVLFDKIGWKLSVLVPENAIENRNPALITPWDISIKGISFMTDSPLKLNSSLDLVIFKPEDEAMLVSCYVARVDQIRKVDEPDMSYKIVTRFNDLDIEHYNRIRGITE
ncbi:MAG: hypothetical protein JXA66_05650 [Oligoflexia bacterium]|nr:hypothetical protein [Oligoflexia bacterium]